MKRDRGARARAGAGGDRSQEDNARAQQISTKPGGGQSRGSVRTPLAATKMKQRAKIFVSIFFCFLFVSFRQRQPSVPVISIKQNRKPDRGYTGDTRRQWQLVT